MRSIPSPNYGGTRGTVRWVVVHTAEGSTSVDSLGRYFANPASQVSSHVGIDDHEIVEYVDYGQVAWAARSANPVSDQAELCAFAAWTRDQWLAHPAMLENTAQWIADRCRARGIPAVKVTAADVAADRSGVVGHVDLVNYKGDGDSHTDPGAGFPWASVMARVQALLAPATPPVVVPPKPVATPGFDVKGWRASYGATGQVFVDLQTWANRTFPAYARISPAPVYGPATAAFLAEFCRRSGIASDGRDIGPQTAAALYANGFRG